MYQYKQFIQHYKRKAYEFRIEMRNSRRIDLLELPSIATRA